VFGTSVRLAQAAQQEVELRVFAASSVSGRVVASGGEPMANAVVSIRSPSGIVQSARTDALGGFALARAYPGRYSTSVKLAPQPGSAAAAPLPQQFDLAPREERVLPDLVAGAGGHVLRGTALDQDGRPVAGLAVACE